MFKIDLTYLETIAGGDKAFITEMLTMLLSSTFSEMNLMKQLAASQQWAEVGTLAHKIKAPIQMLGVSAVSDLIFEIEQEGKRQSEIAHLPQKVAQLDGYMNDLKQQVEQLLQS